MASINDAAKYFGYNMHTSYVPPLIPRAVIPYLELTFLIDGELTYFLDDEEIRLSSGDAIIIPKGHRRYRPQHEVRATYASFNIITPDDFDPRLSGLIKNAIRTVKDGAHGVFDLRFWDYLLLFQDFGLNSTRIGMISSRPASISKMRISLENTL